MLKIKVEGIFGVAGVPFPKGPHQTQKAELPPGDSAFWLGKTLAYCAILYTSLPANRKHPKP